MPVYREPNQPFVNNNNAPGALFVTNHINLALNGIAPMNQVTDPVWGLVNGFWEVAQSAAYSFDRLFLDLLLELRTAPWNPANLPALGAAVLQDPLDLVTLGYYIYDCVFDPIVRIRTQVLNNAIHPATPSDGRFNQWAQNILALLVLIEARIYGIPQGAGLPAAVAAEGRHVAIQNLRNAWQVHAGNNAGGVPALGFMELLVRIKAQNSTDLANLWDKLRNQQLVSRRADGNARGVPGVIFCCAGQDNPPGSTFVVTTSQDRWYNFVDIHAWSRVNRLVWRPANPPVANPAPAPPAFGVAALSNQLRTLFTAQQANINAAATALAREAVRQGVITAWRGVAAQWADHDAELAMALECPVMDFKARCLRCKTLFGYEVPHQVSTEETRLLQSTSALNFIFNDGFTCAETIGHFYCMNARAGGATH